MAGEEDRKFGCSGAHLNTPELASIQKMEVTVSGISKEGNLNPVGDETKARK